MSDELVKEYEQFATKNPNSKRTQNPNRKVPKKEKRYDGHINEEQRKHNLMPEGVPRYIRLYDNGDKYADGRYTVCFTGKYQPRLWKDGKMEETVEVETDICVHCGKGKVSHLDKVFCIYARNSKTFEAKKRTTTRRREYRWQFFSMFENGQISSYGEFKERIDYPSYQHLGKKIKFENLPLECQNTVRREYEDLWFKTDEELDASE